MRYGILFNEEESPKIENLLAWYGTKDLKEILTEAINILHKALVENADDD